MSFGKLDKTFHYRVIGCGNVGPPVRPFIVLWVERLRKLARSYWVRALVSAGLLGAVAVQIDFGRAGSRLSGGSWGWLVAAVGVLFVSFLLAAFRWRMFLGAAGIETTPYESARAYMIGAFANNFLPSQLGGDVTRAWVVARPGMRVRAAATVVIDRLTALGCLVLVGWLAIAAEPGSVPGTLAVALAAATGVLVVAGVSAAAVVRGDIGWRRLSPRLRVWAGSTRAVVRACVRRHLLARSVLIGIAFQGLVVLTMWLVARAINVPLSFSVLAVTLPPILIVSALPVSIGGFGVREGSYVVLLKHVGISTTDATLLSLTAGVTFALASLPGGLMLLRRGKELGNGRT